MLKNIPKSQYGPAVNKVNTENVLFDLLCSRDFVLNKHDS